jgi:hypothetical protein
MFRILKAWWWPLNAETSSVFTSNIAAMTDILHKTEITRKILCLMPKNYKDIILSYTSAQVNKFRIMKTNKYEIWSFTLKWRHRI